MTTVKKRGKSGKEKDANGKLEKKLITPNS